MYLNDDYNYLDRMQMTAATVSRNFLFILTILINFKLFFFNSDYKQSAYNTR